MRLLVLIVPLALAAMPTVAARPIADKLVLCPLPAKAPEKAIFKRLGDLPPADIFFAVFRSSDCPAQLIQARDRLGTVPKPRR